MREILQRLARNDPSKLEDLKGQESDARAALNEVRRSLFGKGRLPEAQDIYFDAVDRVTYWWQRMALVRFMDELISVADQRCDRWLARLGDWEEALNKVTKECRDGLVAIDQELERQTQITSSSLGTKNTTDMNGYQALLRERCTLDPNSGATFPAQLLKSVRWQAAEEGVVLDGWPGGSPMGLREFAEGLEKYMVEQIRPRMRQQEGMARYLEWLRDRDPGTYLNDLMDKMKRVIADFVDGQPTSAHRKFLLLHGDAWKPGVNLGQDEFMKIYHALNSDPNFRELHHNLLSADGVNQFQDRNVIAILATDNEIAYADIPSVKIMRNQYLQVRANPDNAWRVEAYHTYRCEQEIWSIERIQVQETGDSDVPLISGTWYRLLDEPERVKVFATALALGVVREIDVGTEGRVWVCGSPDADDKAIYLTEPNGDLYRALVTFVQDQKDRRETKLGKLDLRLVKEWCNAALKATGQGLTEAVAGFRAQQTELFALDRQGDDYADPRRAFIALVLDHYLKQG